MNKNKVGSGEVDGVHQATRLDVKKMCTVQMRVCTKQLVGEAEMEVGERGYKSGDGE
ncbi:hypothetical protein PMAC_002348 [Pneumocystis sp. 'macacae']|nr:hypothetical protein PMAC_002348 [Pneumocystis sp. 'macacae']